MPILLLPWTWGQRRSAVHQIHSRRAGESHGSDEGASRMGRTSCQDRRCRTGSPPLRHLPAHPAQVVAPLSGRWRGWPFRSQPTPTEDLCRPGSADPIASPRAAARDRATAQRGDPSARSDAVTRHHPSDARPPWRAGSEAAATVTQGRMPLQPPDPRRARPDGHPQDQARRPPAYRDRRSQLGGNGMAKALLRDNFQLSRCESAHREPSLFGSSGATFPPDVPPKLARSSSG
jgi:hypothetical protein